MSQDRQVEFNRPHKLRYIRELGSGACGETVLLHDDDMQCDFVAKKYKPIVRAETHRKLFAEFQARFKEEARLLFQLSHPNVVRVFNYFDYSEYDTAYILMEHVEGEEVLPFLRVNPLAAEHVFEGVIDGFSHLQRKGVLHRDIRPANVLVNSEGVAKIIDFGFGKEVTGSTSEENDKSISLNWWCKIPPEFDDDIYDFQTEVYFVGRLFELLIRDCNLTEFKYKSIVSDMCKLDRNARIQSFMDVKGLVSTGKFAEFQFADHEVSAYRAFSSELFSVISSTRHGTKLVRNDQSVIERLETLYLRTMLEETLAAPQELAKVFVLGGFTYSTRAVVNVSTIFEFSQLMKSQSTEKRSIILENLLLRLEALEEEERYIDEEIPF